MRTDADKDHLIELERAMWRAETRFDRAFQERHFAADFVEFGRSGRVYDRTQIITTAPHQIDALLENIRLNELSSDIVQITYDSIVRRETGVIEHAHRSSLWSDNNGVWQMRFHQGTPFSPTDSRE